MEQRKSEYGFSRYRNKRIVGQDKFDLGGDVCRSADRRDHLAVFDIYRAFENAADDALLPPSFALASLPSA